MFAIIMNLFLLHLALTYFVVGILRRVFGNNKPVKAILLIARGIYLVLAIIATVVMIGFNMKMYVLTAVAIVFLVTLHVIIRVSVKEWNGSASKRGRRSNRSTPNNAQGSIGIQQMPD